ncbi:hypothetical protein [Pedosphaera parvula]|uniref:Lipoprotein n=1 Tax=Pedosphaera parvula (strain Ellin514) TaxID=320771 RepID=B9XGU8_PEDPL|nr:hypothetical protein [Pedosphaera parvula]EEF60869.1 hypothetical protein Cflav_PD4038 [Pedosphaera parvula Ellin514]
MLRSLPLLFFLLFLSSCATTHEHQGSKINANQISELVEQLVSPIGPPPPEITDYQGGKEDMQKLNAYLKALFEGYEHPQVAKARARLIAMGTPTFPELIKHLQDKRYSYTFCTADWVDYSVGQTVGQIMAEVVGGRFRPYGYKGRRNPHGSNGQPSFGEMLYEFGVKSYAEHAQGMTRDAVEKEYVLWYMAKEKEHGFTDVQQEQKFLGPCLKRLSEL